MHCEDLIAYEKYINDSHATGQQSAYGRNAQEPHFVGAKNLKPRWPPKSLADALADFYPFYVDSSMEMWQSTVKD